ncbi:hypothetical protein Tco_0742206, partial [Tanacetum coccineum]
MKCTSDIRQLAYGNTPDAFDEYLQMGEHIAHNCLDDFNKCIIDLYMSKYLRKPTLADVEKVYDAHENIHGFLGMLGSIDFKTVLVKVEEEEEEDITVCPDEGIDELAEFCGSGKVVAEWTA